MDYTSVDTSQMSSAFGVGYLIGCLIVMVIAFIAQWKIFVKAGRPGWYSLIPIFNIYQMFKIAGMSGWMMLLMFIPIANIIVSILFAINLAKAFGKGGGFAVGLIFLSFIFMLILGFGSAQYQLKN